MDPQKDTIYAHEAPADASSFEKEGHGLVPARFRGTDADKHDMSALGKTQVLRRNFHFITMLGFASTVTASWEFLLPLLGLALYDGGTGDLFWGSIAGAIGMTLVYASIAEMASMSPTAGGQYHWVSEFGPPKLQKQLSYIVGWLCAIGWQVYLAGVAFMVAGIIEGLIILNVPTYEPKPYHTTLLTIAMIVFAIFFNTVMATRLPLVEGAALILHLAGFLAIIIPLWVMAPRSHPHVIFEFSNIGGWQTPGLAAMIGLTIPMGSLIGYDCSVHLSEEIHDASLTLPKAMIWAIIPNAVLCFLMAVTLIFTVGDIDTVLDTATLQPFIQVFYNATGSLAGTTVMTTIIILLLVSCCISEVATASRQIWSFARDRGVPGSTWLSQVTPGWNIPLHAVSVSFVVTSLIACINLGSTTALNAINSLGSIAILSSYFVTIGCLIWRRLKGAPLPPRRWSLGRYGLAVNIAASMFLIPFWFFAFWPLFDPVTPQNMNWACVMFVGTIGFAIIYYLVRGKKYYTGPVELIKRDD